MAQEQAVKLATTAVIQREGKILLGKRTKDDFWELPGGKIEKGEDAQACIIRELKEELDVDFEIEKYLGKITGVFRKIPMEVDVFLVKWTKGSLSAKVHREIRWVSPEDIGKYPLVEEDHVALEKFRLI
jgi:8-oxo-dGTP diphosphatase